MDKNIEGIVRGVDLKVIGVCLEVKGYINRNRFMKAISSRNRSRDKEVY